MFDLSWTIRHLKTLFNMCDLLEEIQGFWRNRDSIGPWGYQPAMKKHCLQTHDVMYVRIGWSHCSIAMHRTLPLGPNVFQWHHPCIPHHKSHQQNLEAGQQYTTVFLVSGNYPYIATRSVVRNPANETKSFIGYQPVVILLVPY